ncbi:hypothetical protein [Hafnia paralvei]|uniref:hypothetical protein n=1 Tax=Hafnia paralvei TaxID=546367 RepID=UPI001033C955|nr:hypothetical protein [Hafnia paralvei]TBL64320.1 hypothetical protein EYY97_04225 [Hafnia paralvei]
MKKVFIAAFITMVSTSSYAATSITGGNTGTLPVSGQLAAATCTVSLNSNNLSFGNINGNTIRGLGNNVTIPSTDKIAKFTFLDCPAGNIKFALNARSRISGDDTKGKITVGGVATDAFYYRAYINSSPFLNLNNVTTGKNLVNVSGANNVGKDVDVHFELARGTGSVSGLSGAFSEAVNYIVSYQ